MEYARVNDEKVMDFKLYDGGAAQNRFGTIEVMKQKHKEKMILAIFSHPGISQMDLGAMLNLSSSGTHAVIKKLNEAEVPPIRSRKAGKFRYYYLTESGMEYAKKLLEQSEEDVGEEAVRELWDIFKEKLKAGKRYIDLLEENIMAEEVKNEDEAVFLEFSFGFLKLYQKEQNAALELLDFLTMGKDLHDGLLEWVRRKTRKSRGVEELMKMFEKDCRLAYGYVDDLFDKCILKDESLDGLTYEMTDSAIFDNLTHELESTVLHAVVRDEAKSELSLYWIEQGMDRQLAYYMAEKFRGVKEKLCSRCVK